MERDWIRDGEASPMRGLQPESEHRSLAVTARLAASYYRTLFVHHEIAGGLQGVEQRFSRQTADNRIDEPAESEGDGAR